ncbi:TIGR03943 family putative permease subunit [Zavarzinella formosa]|uniref:TIGR03943 family putative permease subunit n=1 Tax=Zavarzinella formosa TaxID=360055 RepID=UPI000311ACFF|nr:hypothetical protein [Zavarzinella formosa]
MAHSHAHSHDEGDGTFFQDQLFTILLSAGIGVVAILMYRSNMLERILVQGFWKPVLAGGITIVVLAFIRAIALWQLAGKASPAPVEQAADHGHAHSHAHSHGKEDCGHDHAHQGPCEHDHSHGAKETSHAPHGDDEEEGHEDHDHGWSPWKYIVLAIPIVLFALNLPKNGFSESRLDKEIKGGALQQNPKRLALAAFAGSPVMTKALRKTEPTLRNLRFKELIGASAVLRLQEDYEGDIGTLRGQFYRLPGSDREFTLFRVNMTCCAADSVILETRIVAPEPVDFKPGAWVSVSGVISFQRDEAKKKWVPVLTLKSNDDVQPTEGTTDIDGV